MSREELEKSKNEMYERGLKEFETLLDKNGKKPKFGDFIRITRYDGVDNVVDRIEECERFYYSPAVIKYLEFEIFDGVLTEFDTPIKEVYKFHNI